MTQSRRPPRDRAGAADDLPTMSRRAAAAAIGAVAAAPFAAIAQTNGRPGITPPRLNAPSAGDARPTPDRTPSTPPALLTELHAFTGHTRSVLCGAISPDGSLAITGGYDRALKVWDLETRRIRRNFAMTWRTVWSIDIAEDNKRALVGGDRGNLHHFRIEGGSVLNDLIGDRSSVRVARFIPGADGRGRAISADSRGLMRIWDLENGKSSKVLSNAATSLQAMEISRDGETAITGDVRGGVRLWGLARGDRRQTASPHRRLVWSVALSPDATLGFSGAADGKLVCWDFKAGRQRWAQRAHGRNVVALALTGDGRRLFTGGDDGSIIVWDAPSGRRLSSARRHSGRVNMLSLSAAGDRLLSVGSDRTARVWRFEES